MPRSPFLVALGLALAAPACNEAASEPKQASSKVHRIVAFGDSFADNGNLFRLLRISPPPEYPKGRFSDGTNFVDTMGEMLRAPVLNFALGGAVTGAGDADLRPAGLDLQTRAFLSGGGALGFPRTGGRFGAGDLVVLSIGGNDARAYARRFAGETRPDRLAAAVAGAPEAADRSVANASRALDSLVAAGARRILFLGGDVARLPEMKGRPTASAGSAFSVRYNRGMGAKLARLSANGVTARYLDMDALAARVEANPSAFGLISAGACPAACLTDRKLTRRYLFHVDKLHLSQAGYAILGRYAVEQLAAKP